MSNVRGPQQNPGCSSRESERVFIRTYDTKMRGGERMGSTNRPFFPKREKGYPRIAGKRSYESCKILLEILFVIEEVH